MVDYVCSFLRKKKISYIIDVEGNIIATKGKAEFYPCIASHLDTVQPFDNNLTYKILSNNDRENLRAYDKDGKRAGIGADDKNGILCCFEMLKRFDNIKAVFFTQEESGLIGSTNISHEHFKDVGYIIIWI